MMNPSFYTSTIEASGNYHSQIERWLLNNNPDLLIIPKDLDLLENRLIDSLRFMEFIFFLETLSGSAIDIAQIHIDDFRTIQCIVERYLSSFETVQPMEQQQLHCPKQAVAHPGQDERCA